MPGRAANTKSNWGNEVLHDKNNDNILLIFMVKNWEICLVMDDKGLEEDGGRNRLGDSAKFINMDSLSGDFGLNVLTQVVGSNFFLIN